MSLRQFQQTVAKPVILSGVGLHTGIHTTITIEAANSGFGIRFQRIDLEHAPYIKADVDNVVDTSRGTTLEYDGGRLSTVEHLMAALAGTGIDNALIKIDGPEVPILDGSAKPFIDAILEAGIEVQDAKKTYYSIGENIHYSDPERNVDLLAVPASELQITTLIDFNSNVLGTQHATMRSIRQFNDEIANSRTFCFLHELEYLVSQNLIKGGDVSNAIVVVDKPVSAETLERLSKIFNKADIRVEKEGILNNLELHYPNEPARHKLLDVLGDLMLCGYSINAHIIAHRPGHEANIQFAKAVKKYIRENRSTADIPTYDPSAPPVYDINYIEKVLPHKYPFLLVDKIIEMSDQHVVGIKNVTFNEPFFQGHFPGNPVMPGVLQIEAMAQVGGILALNNMPTGRAYDTYFLKIDKVKFKQKVVPGDTLILKLELIRPIRRGICEMRGTAFIANRVATEAELVAQILPRNDD